MADPSQIRIRLQPSSNTSPSLTLPPDQNPGPILVSTTFSRTQLSQLLNQLLETPKPVPFDLLINNTLLRGSLGDFLTAHGLSSEDVLDIEYTRALQPPTYQSSFKQDDWVSAVDVLSSTSLAGSGINGTRRIEPGAYRLLTSSFDGLLRVWTPSGTVAATSSLCTTKPSQALLTARWLDSTTIISGGFGVPVRTWSYDEISSPDNPEVYATLEPRLDLYGHKGASNCLAYDAGRGVEDGHMLSAGQDGTLSLFSSSLSQISKPRDLPDYWQHELSSSADSHTSKRRRKTSSSTPKVPRTGALATMTPTKPPSSTSTSTSSTSTNSAPLRPLTGTIFHPQDPSAAYTTSLSPHSQLRTFDLETSINISTLTPLHDVGLNCLCALPTLSLLAAGTTGRSISLVDPRAGTGAAAYGSGGGSARVEVGRCTGFRNEVRSVTASPTSPHQLAGASFDGTVRIFDVRNTTSALEGEQTGDGNPNAIGARQIRQIYKIPRRGVEKCDRILGGEGVRCFAVGWDEEVGVVSCGEDGSTGGGGGVQINRGGV